MPGCRVAHGVDARRSTWFWTVYAAVYDLLWDTELADRVAKHVDAAIPPGRPVVEVGAGTGLITSRLLALGRDVEPHEPHAAMRRRLCQRLPHVPVSDAAIADLDFGGSEPTAVVVVNVLHLVTDPLAALARLRRVAGSAGSVVVVTPRPDASLVDLARAQLHHGASWRAAGRFMLLHLVLAPGARLAGAITDPADLMWSCDAPAAQRSDVATVFELLVVDGSAPCRDGDLEPMPAPALRPKRRRRAARAGE